MTITDMARMMMNADQYSRKVAQRRIQTVLRSHILIRLMTGWTLPG